MSSETQKTQEKILDASEELMASKGFMNASIRDITEMAGVHLGSINYHFSSKEKLFHEVCRRKISIINDQRLEMLDRLEAQEETPLLEEILESFLRPALTFEQGQKSHFMKLMARMYVEPGDHWLPVYSMFEVISFRFSQAFQEVLPELSEKEHLWRFNFMIGVMCHSLLRPEQIELISKGSISADDKELLLKEMISFVVAGFKARS